MRTSSLHSKGERDGFCDGFCFYRKTQKGRNASDECSLVNIPEWVVSKKKSFVVKYDTHTQQSALAMCLSHAVTACLAALAATIS